MKKVITAIVVAALLTLSSVSMALATPPNPACNGLDVAHSQIHGSGTQGELQHHDLRDSNHCGH